MRKPLLEAFIEVANEKADYVSQWTYDMPFIITTATNERFARLQKLMYKCVVHLGNEYDQYTDILPLDPRVLSVLSRVKDKPYIPGTYRTDFLRDEWNNVKLIEITCRFALNAFFLTGWGVNLLNQRLAKLKTINRIEPFAQFFFYLETLFGDAERIVVFKGADNRNESKQYSPVFEHAGYELQAIDYNDIPGKLHLLKNSMLILELAQEEILNLPDAVLDAIIQSRHINDLRTILLIHDKRFFSLLNNENFLANALSPEEKKEFIEYLIPTYPWGEGQDIWNKAKKDKDSWIIKPRSLGKSQQIFAGCITAEDDWKRIFESPNRTDLILQPFLKIRKYKGSIGEKQYTDFGVGTLLFFDEQYFGPGLFRASSHPVTNIVDDRKIVPLITDDIDYFKNADVL